jgi:hypothetical protein
MQTHDVLFDSQNKKRDENFEMKQKKTHKCEFKVKLAYTKKKKNNNLCRWKSKCCMDKPHGTNFTKLIMVQNLGRVIGLFLIPYSMINDGDCIEMVIKNPNLFFLRIL